MTRVVKLTFLPNTGPEAGPHMLIGPVEVRGPRPVAASPRFAVSLNFMQCLRGFEGEDRI